MRIADIQIGTRVAVALASNYHYRYVEDVRCGVVVDKLSTRPTVWSVRFLQPLPHLSWCIPTPNRNGQIGEYEFKSQDIMSLWKEYREEILQKKALERALREENAARAKIGKGALVEFKELINQLGYQEDCLDALMVTNNDNFQKTNCQITITPELLQIISQMLVSQTNGKTSALTSLIKSVQD